MSIFTKIFARNVRPELEKRAEPTVAEMVQYQNASAIDPARASGTAVAVSCVSIISQTLAAIPLPVYKNSANGGRERAVDHPLYQVLNSRANETQTAFEAREYLYASVLVSGNAYARVEWNNQGEVPAYYPLDPATVTVERLESGHLRYRVNGLNGTTILSQEEILHMRHRLDRNGVIGISPLQMARETFLLALAQQNTATKQAEKSFRPEGAFVFPQSLSNEAAERLFSKLESKINKNSATSNIFVLDGGADYKSIAFSSRDAEFLESRKLTNLDICRVWNVPPTCAGITDNATFSNVDQESRALVARCLAPMAKRLEQAMNLALLPMESRKTLFVEHDLAGLLRGDQKARYESYRIGREWGWLSVNEIRGWENMPDVEGGDERLSPLNMTPLGTRDEPKPEGQE